MKNVKYNIFGFLLVIISATWSCEQDPYGYDIEYAPGYPNRLAGVWIAYEFPDLIVTPANQGSFYNLITALDPVHSDSIVIDNIYASNVRVKAKMEGDTLFRIDKGRQLEVINKPWGVETVSIIGYIQENAEDTKDDVLTILTVLYDDFDAPVDSLYIQAIRKTGFEDLNN